MDMLEKLALHEDQAIGAMLLGEATYHRATAILRPDDFVSEAHRRAFTTLAASKQPTIEGRMLELARQVDQEDRKLIGSVMARFPHVGRASYWLDIAAKGLVAAHRTRAARELCDRTFLDSDSSGDVLGALEARLRDLSAGIRIDDGSRQIGQLTAEAIEGLGSAVQRRLLCVGLAGFDREWGLPRREVTSLAAKTGAGKSAFALSAAIHNAKMGRSVVYFSVELPSEQLVWRILSSTCGINLGRFYAGALTQTNRSDIVRQHNAISDWKMRIVDEPRLSISRIRSEVSDAATQWGGVDLIVIDYLQLLQAHDPKASRYEAISTLSRECKILAGESDAAVLLISQLSREGIKDGVVPDLHHLKESGAIENDSAMVVFLYDRPEGPKCDQGRKLWLHTRKARHAEPGRLPLIFESALQRFIDPNDRAPTDNQFQAALDSELF